MNTKRQRNQFFLKPFPVLFSDVVVKVFLGVFTKDNYKCMIAIIIITLSRLITVMYNSDVNVRGGLPV